MIKERELNFTVIVDVRNGPGTPPYPGATYVDAITRLNAYEHVQILGYVDVEQGARKNESIFDDIRTYGEWSKKGHFIVHGIFLDHAPFENIKAHLHYMRNITKFVRNTKGLPGPCMIALNPGRLPKDNLTAVDFGANMTIIYEGPYDGIPKFEALKTELCNVTGMRENWGFLVNSLPSNIRRKDMRKMINDARKNVGYLFATDLYEGYYHNWGNVWDEFVELVPS